MNSRSRLLSPAFTAISIAALLVTAAQAATIDYSSTGSSGTFRWPTAANWVGGVAPVNDITTDIARFNQTSYANANINGSTVSIAGVVIGDGTTATAAITISANSFSVGAGGITMNANAGNVTFSSGSTGLVLGANQVWHNASAGGTLDVSSMTVSGNFAVEKTGSGILVLGNGTYTGGFTLTDGYVKLANNAAFGTGTLTLKGGSISASGLSARTLTNAITVSGNSQLGNAAVAGAVTFSGALTVSGNQQLSFVNAGVALTGNVTLDGNLTLNSSISGVVAGNTLSGVIADGNGSHGITKTGTGTIALTGANTFTGDIAIQQGTLRINSGFIADTATVSLDTGAIFNLNFSGTDTIAGLYLAGLAQADGTYGAVGSGASFTSSFFTGSGILNVVASAVPEPSTYALFGGLATLGLAVWRRRSVRR